MIKLKYVSGDFLSSVQTYDTKGLQKAAQYYRLLSEAVCSPIDSVADRTITFVFRVKINKNCSTLIIAEN